MASSTSPKKGPSDPYALLGVDRRADDGAIKRAYFKLVRQFPPESEPERFQEIRAAYEQLRSPERRAQTDLFLLQPPPATPTRRTPSYDLSLHADDLVLLAMELGPVRPRMEDDFRLPDLPA